VLNTPKLQNFESSFEHGLEHALKDSIDDSIDDNLAALFLVGFHKL
jgi:hypothetical protein